MALAVPGVFMALFRAGLNGAGDRGAAPRGSLFESVSSISTWFRSTDAPKETSAGCGCGLKWFVVDREKEKCFGLVSSGELTAVASANLGVLGVLSDNDVLESLDEVRGLAGSVIIGGGREIGMGK